ncbi:MAG: TFIIB-type zinc ribbon-containing protein, partial [Oscillospiraceae bacterium]|nr:TFIIB-type zinc ribbon-containing protein [Oscillospiraceae bacterium]
MYQCPECGTEYTVVPDVCVSCGHVPEENAAVDLLAAAAAHERKTAEQQREQLQQYAARKAEKDAAAMAESADVQETPDAPASAEPVSLPPKTKKRSRKGLKSAAVCGAAAVALGGAAYFVPMFGKPAGFEKSSIGTFYMKDDALWFHNGLNGKAVCVNPELKITQPVYEDIPEDVYIPDDYSFWIVKYLIHASADGKDLYYPKSFSLEDKSCTLMHCTADHPEQAEEAAKIRFMELAYNETYYSIDTFYANSVLDAELPRLDMNPAYLLCGDALYYRDPDGQFCCLRNGQTEVIAPVVERFWTLPEHEGVYYITIPDYDAFKERNGVTAPENAFRPDYSCMSQLIPFRSDSDGSNVNIMLHSKDYALFRTKPGESPQRLIEEGIEDWKPFHETDPSCLYYTVHLPDESATELRRFRFDTESSETISRMNDEGKIALLQDYPDGSCYFTHNSLSDAYAAQVIPDIADSMRRYSEQEGADMSGVLVVMQDESG